MHPSAFLARLSLPMAALMCALPFWLPYHRQPFTAFYGEWFAVALGVAASLLLLRRAAWQPLRLPVTALTLMALTGILGAQVAAGLAVYWQTHFMVGLYLVWAALMIVTGAELRRVFGLEKLADVLAWALLAGGLVSAAIVGIQAVVIDLMPYVVPRRVASYGANLAQVNHLADLLGLALASLLYLAATARLRQSWAGLLALALLFPLALTGARMGWIYVLMLSVGCWWAGRRSGQPSWRAFWLIPAFMAAQVLIPLLSVPAAPMMPAQKVVAAMQEPSSRLVLIQEAWQVFLAHPWLGAGWGQFGWQDFLLAEAYPGHAGWASHAHNIVLHLLAESGLAGALVLGAGMAFWLAGALRAPRTAACWWAYAILGVLGLHSLLEYPLWYAYFLGIAALLLGATEERPLALRFDPGPLAAAALGVFGVFCLYTLASQYAAIERLSASLSKPATHEARHADLERLSGLARTSLFAPVAEVLLVQALPHAPELVVDRLALSRNAVRYLPSRALVYDHAASLALAGRAGEALATLRRALRRYPEYADAYAARLMRIGYAETLPLLAEVGRFNRERLGIRSPTRRERQ